MGILSGTIAIAVLLVSCDNIKKAKARAGMAEDLNNMRQVKIALDAFTMDFNGQFPNEKTQSRVWSDASESRLPSAPALTAPPAPTTSNDYFRQLFLTGQTRSEDMFWVDGASVCSKSPPDNDVNWRPEGMVEPTGLQNSLHRISPAKILEKGDCGLAYVPNQENTFDGKRVLVVSAYKKGTSEFDSDLYRDGNVSKVLVIRIDGSAKGENLNASGKLLDNDGADLLKDAK